MTGLTREYQTDQPSENLLSHGVRHMISGFPHESGPPSQQGLEQMLGTAVTNWNALIDILENASGTHGTWKSYGPRYGWRLDFRRGPSPLAGLYPHMDGPLLGINLIQKEWAPAFELPLGTSTKALLESSDPLKDGRFLLLRITDSQTVQDARSLIHLKTRKSPGA